MKAAFDVSISKEKQRKIEKSASREIELEEGLGMVRNYHRIFKDKTKYERKPKHKGNRYED
jgi:hypothetical protein